MSESIGEVVMAWSATAHATHPDGAVVPDPIPAEELDEPHARAVIAAHAADTPEN